MRSRSAKAARETCRSEPGARPGRDVWPGARAEGSAIAGPSPGGARCRRRLVRPDGGPSAPGSSGSRRGGSALVCGPGAWVSNGVADTSAQVGSFDLVEAVRVDAHLSAASGEALTEAEAPSGGAFHGHRHVQVARGRPVPRPTADKGPRATPERNESSHAAKRAVTGWPAMCWVSAWSRALSHPVPAVLRVGIGAGSPRAAEPAQTGATPQWVSARSSAAARGGTPGSRPGAATPDR